MTVTPDSSGLLPDDPAFGHRANPEVEAIARIAYFGPQSLVLELTPEDFADPVYREVFVAARASYAANGEVDMFAVERHVKAKAGEAANYAWMGTVLSMATSTMPPEQIVRALRGLRVLRETSGLSARLKGMSPQEVGSFLEKQAAHVRGLLGRKTSALEDYAHEIAQTPINQPLGFPAMDRLLDGGVEHGAVFVIAARPGLGKTSLATSIAARQLQEGRSVFFASLEMSRKRIAERVLCAAWEMPLRQIRENAANAAQVPGKLFIEDRVGGLDGLLSCFASHLDCDLFVIDYFHLLTVQSRESRLTQMEYMSRAIKLFALQNAKPVVLLSQLNRESAKQNREPELYDLRGTGSLEQDADVVTFLHDPDAAADARTASAEDGRAMAGVATIARSLEGRQSREVQWIVRKNRNGPFGTIPLEFHPRMFLFREKP